MVRVELLWSPTVICSNLATKKFWNILVLISLTFILNLVMVSKAEAYCIQNHPQGGRRPQMVQQTLRTSAVACGGWWFLRIKCPTLQMCPVVSCPHPSRASTSKVYCWTIVSSLPACHSWQTPVHWVLLPYCYTVEGGEREWSTMKNLSALHQDSTKFE